MAKNKTSKFQLLILGFIILFSFCLKIYYDYYWPKAEVVIGGHALNVLVADNMKHWQKGLGGRKDLGKYDGMIFLFPTTEQHVFVMREMQFPIDIIWIKGNEIVDMAPSVPLGYQLRLKTSLFRMRLEMFPVVCLSYRLVKWLTGV